MRRKTKIMHHSHTGRLRPHEHTSYVSLAIMLIIAGAILTLFSVQSLVSASPGPEAGSVSLSGTLPAAPPTIAAVIQVPVNGQHFSTSPITVSGTCPDATMVVIYKSDIFAGSTPCDSGKFTLQIDLLIGPNILIARVYDALNQAGPDSDPVTVTYDILPPQPGALTLLNLPDKQLILHTDPFYRGVFPGQTLNVPISILGGVAPYAINVEWGDATNKVISRGDDSTFNASHIYKKPGTYRISIQATDTQGRIAFLQIVAIVNGQPDVIAAANASSEQTTTNRLLILWPLYAIAAAVVVSFWLGEQREKRILAKQALHANMTPVS